MSATIAATSICAASFPALEVPYEDLLGLPYRPGGRGPAAFDCIGLVLEIYRRAGVKLPDPMRAGNSIGDFSWLFAEVLDGSSQLYDLCGTQLGQQHVGVVARRGLVLDCTERRSVCQIPIKRLERAKRRWWRVRQCCLPM